MRQNLKECGDGEWEQICKTLKNMQSCNLNNYMQKEKEQNLGNTIIFSKQCLHKAYCNQVIDSHKVIHDIFNFNMLLFADLLHCI